MKHLSTEALAALCWAESVDAGREAYIEPGPAGSRHAGRAVLYVDGVGIAWANALPVTWAKDGDA